MAADDEGKVWLYDGSAWSLVPDPIEWSERGGDDVFAKYAEAGYAEHDGDCFLALHPPGGDDPALWLWVRPGKPPECLIHVDGTASSAHTVYAARLPDGLDLMARWAPIVRAGPPK
jgi:hypothetical protein